MTSIRRQKSVIGLRPVKAMQHLALTVAIIMSGSALSTGANAACGTYYNSVTYATYNGSNTVCEGSIGGNYANGAVRNNVGLGAGQVTGVGNNVTCMGSNVWSVGSGSCVSSGPGVTLPMPTYSAGTPQAMEFLTAASCYESDDCEDNEDGLNLTIDVVNVGPNTWEVRQTNAHYYDFDRCYVEPNQDRQSYDNNTHVLGTIYSASAPVIGGRTDGGVLGGGGDDYAGCYYTYTTINWTDQMAPPPPPPPTVVNGACSGTAGQCTTGTPISDNNATACGTTRSWQCQGSGGGTTDSCSIANAACPPPPAGCTTYVHDEGPVCADVGPNVGNVPQCVLDARPALNGELCSFQGIATTGNQTGTAHPEGFKCATLKSNPAGKDAGHVFRVDCSGSPPVVVNGACSGSAGQCTSGTPMSDNNATACGTTRSWQCEGSGGGTTAPCSITNPVCPPAAVNGVCGTNGACTNGSPTGDNGATACNTTRTWTCNGSGGGTNAPCSQANGTCAPECGSADGVGTATIPSSNLCTHGTASSVVDGGTQWTWHCAP